MSTLAVARKDFRDAARSRALWVLVVLFVLANALFAWATTELTAGTGGGTGPGGLEAGTAVLALFGMVAAVIFLVPLTGIVLSTKAVVKERETGSIRFLLSLPHTRRDVVLGKFLGRSAVLTVGVLAGFAAAAVVFVARLPTFPAPEFLMFVLVTVLFGVVFVALGLGVSAAVSSETRATILAGVVFVLFGYLWSPVLAFANGQLGLLNGQAYEFVNRFSLQLVFTDALVALFALSRSEVAPTIGSVATGAGSGAPFYLQAWFAFVVFAVWMAVPVTLGYLRFRGIDL